MRKLCAYRLARLIVDCTRWNKMQIRRSFWVRGVRSGVGRSRRRCGTFGGRTERKADRAAALPRTFARPPFASLPMKRQLMRRSGAEPDRTGQPGARGRRAIARLLVAASASFLAFLALFGGLRAVDAIPYQLPDGFAWSDVVKNLGYVNLPFRGVSALHAEFMVSSRARLILFWRLDPLEKGHTS